MWTYQTKVILTLSNNYQTVYRSTYETLVYWSIEGKTVHPETNDPVPIVVGPNTLYEIIRPWDTEESALEYMNLIINARKANNDPPIDVYLYLYPMEDHPTVIKHLEYK